MPPGYRVLLDDRQLMKGEAFFVPGANKASWNNVAPATRFLVREQYYQQVRSQRVRNSTKLQKCLLLW